MLDTTVLELPAPTAPRLRRPGWRDPRLLAGVVMVAAAVALGSWAVRTAQGTVPVYAARDGLVPGDAVTAADLTVVEVRLSSAQLEAYLRADEPLPEPAVALRVVAGGELVPLTALGAGDALDVRPVAIALSSAPSSGVVPGAVVDVWFLPEQPLGVGDEPVAEVEPRQLASGLTVAEVALPEGAFGAAGAGTVHVLVPSAQLPDVLAALAADGTLEVVPVPGAGG